MDSHNLFPVDEEKQKMEKMAKMEKMEKKEKVVTDELNHINSGNQFDQFGSVLSNITSDQINDIKSKKNKIVKVKDPAKNTKTQKAGLFFPVPKIQQKLKHLVPAHCRVSTTSAVFLSAVIEYLVAELVQITGHRAQRIARGPAAAASTANPNPNDPQDKSNPGQTRVKKSRITPRLIHLAIQEDHEFAEFLSNVTLSQGGVVPMTDKRLKEQMTAHKLKSNGSNMAELMKTEFEKEDANAGNVGNVGNGNVAAQNDIEM